MWRGGFVAAALAGVLASAAAITDAAAQVGPASPAAVPPEDQLLGAIGGLRDGLAGYGVTFSLQETSEVFGNATGGKAAEVAYDGETEAAVQLDTGVKLGLPGGLFDASAIDVHGRNLTTDTLGVWQTLTSVEADRGPRLWELWYQQRLPGGIDLRLGQQSLDQEFMVDADAVVLVNGAFGWPLLPSLDLPGGGPAYPLSVPGARLHASLGGRFEVLAGLYNGSPSPQGCTGDAQHCDASGTSFPLDGGQMAIAELQWAVPGAMGPAGAYKLGFWFDTQRVAGRSVAGDGLMPTGPLGAAVARGGHGDWSVYGLADRTVWRAAEGLSSVGVFARAEGAPGDRNLVDIAATAGVLIRAPFVRRDQDAASFGIGYGAGAAVAGSTLGADRAGPDHGARGGETVLEATYLAQLRGWLQVQPDLQYFFNPSGGGDDTAPTRRSRNALVLGTRLTAVF